MEVGESASAPRRGWPWGPGREVKTMEVMFMEAQYLPVMGSLVMGGLLLAAVVCAVAYGWFSNEPARAAEERKVIEFKKAA